MYLFICLFIPSFIHSYICVYFGMRFFTTGSGADAIVMSTVVMVMAAIASLVSPRL
jgi:hypothetical protein